MEIVGRNLRGAQGETPRLASWVAGLAAVLSCGGCWEEIHYVPKPEAVQAEAEVTDAVAEELPAVGIVEPAPVESAEAPSGVDPPIAEAEAPPAPGAEELFSADAPAVAADTAEAEASKVEGDEGAVLPTPEGLAADFERKADVADEGGRRGDPAATAEERRLVWEAASKWSLAAAYYAKGRDDLRLKNLDNAQTAAAKIDVNLPPLPAASGDQAIVESLQGESAVALTNAMANRFGAAEAALADLAIRSNLLLLIYTPQSGDALLQAESLRRAGEASGLPIEWWTPLLTLVSERAPFVEVRQAVFSQDKQIAERLGR